MSNGLAQWLDDIRWLEVKNSGGSTVPAYGLCRVTGVESDNEALTVGQPNAAGGDVLVNGPTDIAASDYGSVYAEWLVDALYDTGDGTPAVGEIWGAGASSYKLRKGNWGFVIVGGPTSGRVLAARLGRGLDVRKNSTGSVYRQPRLNLIEGSGVTLTVAEDTTDNEVDVTIAASGGGSFSGCRARKLQNVGGGSTNITFSTEVYDDGGWHDTGSNTERFTVPSGVSKVLVTVHAAWDSNTTGTRTIGLTQFDSGSSLLYAWGDFRSAAIPVAQNLSMLVNAVAGDYFVVSTEQTSGGNRDVTVDFSIAAQ